MSAVSSSKNSCSVYSIYKIRNSDHTLMIALLKYRETAIGNPSGISIII